MEADDDPARGTPPAPADRLRVRAEATDRSARFDQRLAEVAAVRARRLRRRRFLLGVWVAVIAGVGALVPIVVAAVAGGPAPSGRVLLAAAAIGAVVGVAAPRGRDALARRRGATAWDAYRERYVLLGNPAADVRDADRPEQQHGGPPLPPDRH